MTNSTRASIKSTGFRALILTQFFEALNDNILKTVASLFLVGTAISQETAATSLSIAQGMFVIPFLLFSPFAGWLADRFSKGIISRIVKIIEVAVVIGAAFVLSNEHAIGIYVVLFCMGFHSAIFSPSKYGILPEILEKDDLSKGNGFVQLATFLAIIFGSALGGLVYPKGGGDLHLANSLLILVAIFGVISSLYVTKTPRADPNARFSCNPLYGFLVWWRMRQERSLFLTTLAIGLFWFLGQYVNTTLFLYGKSHLGSSEEGTALLLATLGLGIGIGSVLAGKVSEGRVEMGLVPIGALGLSTSLILLYFTRTSYEWTVVVLSLLGLSSGFFIVPLSSFLQAASPKAKKGEFIAASNLLSFSGILLSQGIIWLLQSYLGISAALSLALIGIFTLFATGYICWLLPEALLRCLNWIITHSFYKVRVLGAENIPTQSGALIISNHASFVDPSLLLASIDRPIRFLMFRPLYEMFPISLAAKGVRAIPISGGDKPREIALALQEARKRVEAGELVCIFAEGGITRLGLLLPFRKGFERIMDGLQAPIIPAYIDRIWGSIFSFHDGKVFWKLPKRIRYPVTINFGTPMASSSKGPEVRQAVQELSSEAFRHRSTKDELLHWQLLREGRRSPFREVIADSSGKRLKFYQLITLAFALARTLRIQNKKRKMVGILLPTGVGGVVSNIAALFAGCVPVNLNFTASKEAFDSAITQCDISEIITSSEFQKKLNISIPSPLLIEDLINEISLVDKIIGMVIGFFVPIGIVGKMFGWNSHDVDSIATVMFSSGTTGTPKGVMLSHGNISSNVQALYDVFQVRSSDVVVGVLPLFHSFGFTGTLWFPLLSRIRAVYHPNPIDGPAIGALVEKEKGSLFVATPTFLSMYSRRVEKELFQSLRLIVCGAEKLSKSVAATFYEKFGIVPLEGYGCTELSPVAIVNLPNFEQKGIKQIGNKPGSVGHPLPGVAVKVVDPDTNEVLGVNRAGLLLIKGPNVMLGYLGQPEKTAEVVRDGWYNTGDLALVDDDGFVTITDRLSRFSKIGGEMVPHVRVEEEIHRLLEAKEQIAVVVGVKDEKKGERLVVLLKKGIDKEELFKKFSTTELPNLWIPKRDSFIEVDEFPLLGTGKLDLKRLKEIAEKETAAVKMD